MRGRLVGIYTAETGGKPFRKAKSARPTSAPALRLFETKSRRLMESNMNVLLREPGRRAGNRKQPRVDRRRAGSGFDRAFCLIGVRSAAPIGSDPSPRNWKSLYVIASCNRDKS